MTRYLIFIFFGLTLSFFILITAPDNSVLVDIIGLITFAIGTGLYLKKIKTAGLLTAIGLGVIFHVIGAWWYNLIIIHGSTIETSYIWLIIYVLLTTTFLFLIGFSIYSTMTIKKIENKLENINFSNNQSIILTILPITLLIIEIVFCLLYMR